MNILIKKIYSGFIFGLMLIGFVACHKPDNTEPKILSIDPTSTFQTISGFGAANQMWGNTFPNATDMKAAYGMDLPDLGLSIFRVRVASDPNEWPLIVDVVKEAKKYGAKILASPWSPPAALKSNGSDIGGHLPEENYEAFADHLNDFITYMESQNASIDVISIQNEPDIQVSYESCDWTALQIQNFLKEYGHLINSKIAAPESFNFNQSITNAILNDAGAAANVDIVAGHIYGGGLAPFPNAESNGKEIWMTEYLMNLNTGNAGAPAWTSYSEQAKWDETLQMMSTIHQAMGHNWNAYIWWYMKRYYSFIGDGTSGTASGEILKRGYAFSHFAKFVRPEYVRVNVEFPVSDIQITAYQGDGKTVAVIINPGASSVTNVAIAINGETPSIVTKYVTTLSSSRIKTNVEKKDENFIFSIEPKSVTTIVVED